MVSFYSFAVQSSQYHLLKRTFFPPCIFFYCCHKLIGYLHMAQIVKHPPAMWETWVRSLGWEDPLEEGMATHSSILAWRIPTDRGAWWAIVHVAESDTTEQLSTAQDMGLFLGSLFCFTDLLYLFYANKNNIFITIALWYSSKLGSVMPPDLFFFLRITLAIQDSCGSIKMSVLLYFCEKCLWNW